MIRGPSPDDICALCDLFKLKDAEPAYREAGMGICQKRVDTPMFDLVYVAWSNPACVSHRVDRPNLAARRQYVQQQKANEANEQQAENGINN